MRKDKLIKMLQDIPGNPEVLLWNGMVGDWMDIDNELVPSDLVKQTKEYWLEMCRLEECSDLRDWSHQLPDQVVKSLSAKYNKLHQWEFNFYVTLEDVKAKRYKLKKVYILNAKKRGTSCYDRLGSIEY